MGLLRRGADSQPVPWHKEQTLRPALIRERTLAGLKPLSRRFRQWDYWKGKIKPFWEVSQRRQTQANLRQTGGFQIAVRRHEFASHRIQYWASA